MGSYTLGMDIGSRSIGWALVDTGEKSRIVDIGVRVFPEGVERDTKGMEKSKNAARREARGSRRVRYRRKKRRKDLVKELRGAGLLRAGEEELARVLESDPYMVRRRGVDERLEPYEIGRALYHINQRRGFKSNRKSEKREDGQIAKEAGELQRRIDDAHCRTLGEYLAMLDPEEERYRQRYTFRSMYEKEFDVLWESQRRHWPNMLTDELRQKVRNEIIFFQRPLKPTDELIGDCELEAGEKRCARGNWYARRFRLLQDVNNLKLCHPDGTVQSLSKEQRKFILDDLSEKKEVRFSAIRKKLGLLESEQFNAEYQVNEKGKKNEKLRGDEFNAGMRKVFGAKAWAEMAEEEKIRLNDWMVELDDDELVENLASEYSLNEEQIEKALKVSLAPRYMSFSRKAIEKLLPLMEKGKRTDEALEASYPDRRREGMVEEVEKLGVPADLRNPIVNRALVEVRKVVNALIREYGKPGRIKIEMARDVRGNSRERRQDHFKMLENKKRNEEVRKRLIEDDIVLKPSREDIIKYKLWEECGHICPYTGKHISLTALFGPNPTFQIEHILPYSRSLDDSFLNKTLCEVHENVHVKKDQSPYEAYGHDAEKMDELKQRVNKTAMPHWKKRKFWQKEIATDEIISRELNDTRYVCRETVRYLKGVCENVSGTRGKVTSELAYQWGFVKDRDDHRQHAVDAAVVAVTRNKHLRELGRTKYSKEGPRFAPPWPHFREELAEKVKHINVSHRANRKVSGALHEETNYGPTGRKDEKGQDIFVYRKRLEDLTIAMVGKIVDGVVREIVKGRLRDKGVDLSGRGKITKEVWQEPLYMRNTKSEKKVQIKKVRIEDVFNNMIPLEDDSGRVYRAVAPGSNHHIEIFEYKDDKGRVKRGFDVVSMYEAVRRSQRGDLVVSRRHGEQGRFLFSLGKNEMVMLELEGGDAEPHRVQKIIQDGRIILRPHTYAGKIRDSDQPPLIQRKNATTLQGHKVVVDVLGRIYAAND